MKQFAPGSSSEVLITSADSRIRVIDGAGLVHKFKGKNQFVNFIWSSMNNYLLLVISCNLAFQNNFCPNMRHKADIVLAIVVQQDLMESPECPVKFKKLLFFK